MLSAWGRCSTTQIGDVGQDTAEQVAGHGHLGHLEDGVAGMGDELRADLHEFAADTGQRPVLHLLRKREGAQEVDKVGGKRMRQAHEAGAVLRCPSWCDTTAGSI